MKNNSKIIIDALNKYYPKPKCELNFNEDYELLLAVMLSAQSTDKRVNEVTSSLFKKYNTIQKLNELSINEIEQLIKPVGLYNTKSKNFKKIVESIYNIGTVPNDRTYLMSLPGVGRKTANVVLSVLYNEPCIAVDTHVTRVSKRLNIAKENDNVEAIEKKLMVYFPMNTWSKIHLQMVLFGRYNCTAYRPKCNECLLSKICKKNNG